MKSSFHGRDLTEVVFGYLDNGSTRRKKKTSDDRKDLKANLSFKRAEPLPFLVIG